MTADRPKTTGWKKISRNVGGLRQYGAFSPEGSQDIKLFYAALQLNSSVRRSGRGHVNSALHWDIGPDIAVLKSSCRAALRLAQPTVRPYAGFSWFPGVPDPAGGARGTAPLASALRFFSNRVSQQLLLESQIRRPPKVLPHSCRNTFSFSRLPWARRS